MKNNKLKGITLIETVLYVGLFSIIIIIIMNFMLSTQEATQRTTLKGKVYRTSEFVTHHINHTFDKALLVNEINSQFGVQNGVLELNIGGELKQYYIQDSTLYYDGVPITHPNIVVSSFILEPVYDRRDNIAGIRTSISIMSKENSKFTEQINLLSIIR